MKSDTKARSLSGIAALLVLAVFAVSVLCVLLGGASVYRRVVARDRESYETRTCIQYLTTKLRQAPSPGAVASVAFGEGDGLAITQIIEGEAYVTRIYCHEGWIMELFSSADGEFSPEDGEKILQAGAMAVQVENGLVRISVTEVSGEVRNLTVALRGWEVAG